MYLTGFLIIHKGSNEEKYLYRLKGRRMQAFYTNKRWTRTKNDLITHSLTRHSFPRTHITNSEKKKCFIVIFSMQSYYILTIINPPSLSFILQQIFYFLCGIPCFLKKCNLFCFKSLS